MSDSYCNRCLRQFRSPKALWQHEDNSRFHESLVHVCIVCEEGFQEEYELEDHQDQQSHYPYTCRCGRVFGNENNLREHSKVHLPRNLECTHCEMQFSLLGGLFLHIESATCPNGLDRPYLNSVAKRMDRNGLITLNYSFDPDDDDDVRDNYEYDGYRDEWECQMCDDTYEDEDDVVAHLESDAHRENMYFCYSCLTEFKYLSALAQHLESKKCHWPRGMKAMKNLVYGLKSGKRFTL